MLLPGWNIEHPAVERFFAKCLQYKSFLGQSQNNGRVNMTVQKPQVSLYKE
jgi:hypothetical protein